MSAPPPLSDKKQRPTEDSIGLALGRAAGAWRVLFEHLRVRKGKPIGKLRPVGVRFGPQRGVRDVLTLNALKDGLT